MNDHDRSNLDFLMNVSKEVFEDWAAQADDDDIAYALELIALARAELSLKLVEVADDVEDFTEAKELLRKFTLNK